MSAIVKYCDIFCDIMAYLGTNYGLVQNLLL